MPDVDWIRRVCLALPDTTENMQWGDDLCFKVRGKLFTIVDLSKGKQPPLCFKCTPEKFHELIEIEGIAPAPYVGRYKWVLMSQSDLLDAAELEELIQQSYELVVANAPKKKKPAKENKAIKQGSKKSVRKKPSRR